MSYGEVVTIITPYFNSYSTFSETFKSVHGQTFRDFRWIIIDDGSSPDQYLNLCNLVASDLRCQVVRNMRTKGPGGARNTGLDLVSTRYVTFIDSDDVWDDDFLEFVLRAIADTAAPCVFTGYRRIVSGKYCDDFIPSNIVKYEQAFRGCDISCLTAIYDLASCSVLPYFGEIPVRNDLVFVLNFLRQKEWALALPVVKASYFIGNSNSVSSNKIRAFKYQYLVSRRFGRSILISSLDVLLWSFYGVVKYRRIILGSKRHNSY